MAGSPRNQLRTLQRLLYEQAYTEASSIVAGQSRDLLKYSGRFENSLPEKFTSTSLTDLLETAKKKKFILYGDFHSLRQSQRGFLRLLRNFKERLRDKRIVIALEMFKVKDQIHIDEFMNDELSESEFLKIINYAFEWGFPWQNFKMILDFAKHNKLKVIGINSDNGGKDTLVQRDKFAAKSLLKAGRTYPNHKIFCLIGEYHLADNHLPSKLWKESNDQRQDSSIMRIVSNVDRYYFQLPQKRKMTTTDYIKLKKDFYCIMNTPPWMKWQSFSIWEEMRNSEIQENLEDYNLLDDDLSEHTEDSFDIDYQFLRFCQNICSFLNFTLDENNRENFDIYYSRDGDFYSDILHHQKQKTTQIERIIGRSSIDGVYFLSDSNTVLLSHISINNLAEAAGQYVQSLLGNFTDLSGNESEQFYRRVIKFAVGMLASKILNPRRQCGNITACKQFLYHHKGRRLHGRANCRKKAAAAAIKHHNWITKHIVNAVNKPKSVPKSIITTDIETDYELSKYLGHWIGANLHAHLINNSGEVVAIKRRLFQEIQDYQSVWDITLKLYELALVPSHKLRK